MILPSNYKLVQAAFHMKPVPGKVLADLVIYDGGAYYAIRLYRENFDSQPESIRVAATEWAIETATRMSQITPTSIEAWETPPEGKRK